MFIYAELRAIWLSDYINDDYIEARLSDESYYMNEPQVEEYYLLLANDDAVLNTCKAEEMSVRRKN